PYLVCVLWSLHPVCELAQLSVQSPLFGLLWGFDSTRYDVALHSSSFLLFGLTFSSHYTLKSVLYCIVTDNRGRYFCGGQYRVRICIEIHHGFHAPFWFGVGQFYLLSFIVKYKYSF